MKLSLIVLIISLIGSLGCVRISRNTLCTLERVDSVQQHGVKITCKDAHNKTNTSFISDGADGNPGIAGNDGERGTDGQDGIQGESGSAGINGTNGLDGISSADGQDGIDGTDGVNGTSGINGADGQSCSMAESEEGITITCPDGSEVFLANGTDGTDGTDGTNGLDGAVGADGERGSDGQDGIDGAIGENGGSCSVTCINHSTRTVIECEDGSSVTIKGHCSEDEEN
jgi:hypothetical protein